MNEFLRLETATAILVTNGQQRVVKVNETARLLLKYEPEGTLVGRELAELFAFDERVRFLDGHRSVEEGLPLFITETRLVDFLGREVPVCALIERHQDGESESRYMIILRTLDTTCPLVDQIGQREQRYRGIIEHLHVGVLVQGPAAEMLVWNSKALDMLGITEEQLRGRTSFDPRWHVIHEDGSDFPGPTHPVPVAIAEKRSVRGVVMGVFRPMLGDRVWLLVDAEPHMDEAGNVKEVICTFSNISERKMLEESILQAQKLDLVGHLAGSVAHDFNNLLSIITTMTELLLAKLPDNPPRREDLQLILDVALRGTSLTRQLLNASGNALQRPQVICLDEALSNMQGLLWGVTRESVTLGMELHAGPRQVRIDPTHLEQIVLNLTINARDALESDGQVEIRTHAIEAEESPGRENSMLELLVSDSGKGIPAEAIEQIFEPFFTTKGAEKGTGLGLYSVRGLVERAGGTVRVDSEEGKGTTVRVLFPEVMEPKDPVSSAELQSAGEKGGVILIVDDNEVLRGVLASFLRTEGFEVLLAPDGPEALAIASVNHIDLVLTDVIMRKMDGATLREELTKVAPDAKILYMSGYVRETVERLGIDSEGVDFIAKPFSTTQLLLQIDVLLAA